MGGPKGEVARRIRVSLADAPKGLSVESSSLETDGLWVTLAADATAAEVGARGNLILQLALEQPTREGARARSPRLIPLGVAPAVPFEVVASSRTGSRLSPHLVILR